MKKLALFLLLSFVLTSCATPNKKLVTIETDPSNAKILVDGAYIGDSPIETKISSNYCRWVGLMNSPNGKECSLVTIQALPKLKGKEPLYSQEVRVNPDTMVSSKIFMDLHLEPIMPTQTFKNR